MKKHIIFALSAAGFITLGFVVFSKTIEEDPIKLFSSDAPVVEHTITFNSTKCYSTGATDVTYRTSNGNNLGFKLTNYSHTFTSSSYWGTFGNFGMMQNADAITGLKSISYTLYSSTSNYITIDYGWAYNDYEVNGTIINPDVEYDFCGDSPSFFRIQFGSSNVNIKSITIKYSCAESEKPASPGITYSLLNDNTYQVDSYKGNNTEVTIPTYRNGKAVTAIGSSAFNGRYNLTTITLPSTLKTIGFSAFHSCSKLHNITLPSSLTTIGSYAFARCNMLESIVLPSSVTEIGSSAFYEISNPITIYCEFKELTNLFDSDWNGSAPAYPYVLGYVGSGTSSSEFEYGLSKIDNVTKAVITGYTGSNTSITIPSMVDGYSVASIADGAFANKSTLTSVTISPNISSIPNSCFYNCSSLSSVSFPSSVVTIKKNAFASAPLTNIPSLINIERIEESAFTYALTSQTSVTFGNLNYLGEKAFYHSYLSNVILPAGVTSIPSECFNYCESLENITINGAIELIGYNAFSNCTLLKEIYIPATAVVEGYAFDGCASLKILCEPESKPSSWSSQWVPSGRSAVIWGVTSIFTSDNYRCVLSKISGFTTLHIINYMNKSVTSLNIPLTINAYPVKYIEYSAFSGLTSLVSVTIPRDVIKIDKYAFQGCINLETVTFESGSILQSIGDYAFSCKKLTTIVIPNFVESIGSFAFNSCSSMTSAYIPCSVTTIGMYAFPNNKNLTINCEAPSKPSGWNSYWKGALTVVNWGV